MSRSEGVIAIGWFGLGIVGLSNASGNAALVVDVGAAFTVHIFRWHVQGANHGRGVAPEAGLAGLQQPRPITVGPATC